MIGIGYRDQYIFFSIISHFSIVKGLDIFTGKFFQTFKKQLILIFKFLCLKIKEVIQFLHGQNMTHLLI